MRSSAGSWILRLAAPVLVCMGFVHCGGSTQKVGGTGSPPEAGVDVGDCVNGVCPSGSSCFFPIGSCGAKGQCIENPSPGTPVCNAIESLCGCEGSNVITGCGFPSGYASGPTTGHGSCGTILPPDPEDGSAETGTEGGEDAGTEGGDEASSPVEAGTHVGACGDGGTCPSGSSCFYAIGSCGVTGACIENPSPSTPVCNAIESLCGCDGSNVITGCGFPGGYASGPTLGNSTCPDSE
jgi:hypothetical protein